MQSSGRDRHRGPHNSHKRSRAAGSSTADAEDQGGIEMTDFNARVSEIQDELAALHAPINSRAVVVRLQGGPVGRVCNMLSIGCATALLGFVASSVPRVLGPVL